MLSKYHMKHHSLGEFEELVLLTVAALYDDAYGVNIHGNLVKTLSKKINISAIQCRAEEDGR